MPSMTTEHELLHRIDELEIHVAHLEKTQQELSDVMTRQWDAVTHLAKTVNALRHALETLEPSHESRKPPHY
ncbi:MULTISPECIES: SlyX family protein [unclassified Haematospirillum]|uniref:SlyX family protein n=1 Tax=unclassified Haematospirillum TaxID=2622088 RepID=UPI00143AFD7F|nr:MULTISPECIES: SlyX family protein [unclassified Haematospirillum]NKD54350.1 SlyX family protein [Haematospirillum sp. H4890]NKD86935.1 SlyX family protein [Haematospirillum sp. 15-248]